jgi:hypothetical protein
MFILPMLISASYPIMGEGNLRLKDHGVGGVLLEELVFSSEALTFG